MDPVMDYLSAHGVPKPEVIEYKGYYLDPATTHADYMALKWFNPTGQMILMSVAAIYKNPTMALVCLAQEGLAGDVDVYNPPPFVEHKPAPPPQQTGVGAQFANDPYPPTYYRVAGPWPPLGTVVTYNGKTLKAVEVNAAFVGPVVVWQEQ